MSHFKAETYQTGAPYSAPSDPLAVFKGLLLKGGRRNDGGGESRCSFGDIEGKMDSPNLWNMAAPLV